MKRTDITTIFPEATEEQVKALMTINGADINNAKKNTEDLQTQLTQANARIEELEKGAGNLEEAQANAKKFEDELNALKESNAVKEVREKVSKATGVPMSLLTGTNEEDCTAQATAIREYARPSAYPRVQDGGEAGGTGKSAPRDQFAEWFGQQF